MNSKGYHSLVPGFISIFIDSIGPFKLLCDFARISHFLPRNDTNTNTDTNSKDFTKKKSGKFKKKKSFLSNGDATYIIGEIIAKNSLNMVNLKQTF